MIGPGTTALLFGVALLVFGPKKLPELGKSIGQALGSFKKGLQEAESEVRSAMNAETSSDGASLKPATAAPAPAATTAIAAETDPKASSG